MCCQNSNYFHSFLTYCSLPILFFHLYTYRNNQRPAFAYVQIFLFLKHPSRSCIFLNRVWIRRVASCHSNQAQAMISLDTKFRGSGRIQLKSGSLGLYIHGNPNTFLGMALQASELGFMAGRSLPSLWVSSEPILGRHNAGKTGP